MSEEALARWTRRILVIAFFGALGEVSYLYANTIMGWFPLLSQYPAPFALAFVFTLGQWEVAVRGPKRRRQRIRGEHSR